MDIAMDKTELMKIRTISREEGCFSWTSEKFQNDILTYIFNNIDKGYGVVEVGCYKGGLSAQIAFACKELNWPLYCMDIDKQFLDITKALLEKLGYGNSVTFFTGNFAKFVQRICVDKHPLLVVIDGDHRYESVVKDIQSLYLLNNRSYAAAFHDFSLRHPTTGEQVDKAVLDSFGTDLHLLPIGGQITEDSPVSEFPTQINPAPDGHYWNRPGYEGVIVQLPDTLLSKQKPELSRKINHRGAQLNKREQQIYQREELPNQREQRYNLLFLVRVVRKLKKLFKIIMRE